MSGIQDILSKAQAVPVVGPIFVSPVKAKVSIIEIVGGLAATAFLGLATVFSVLLNPSKAGQFWDFTCKTLALTGEGVIHLAYSIANMASLGIIGFVIET